MIDNLLADLDLPDSVGLVTFERMFAFAPDVPIIVLTEVSDESLGITTVQGGAQDYLVRDEVTPSLLARAVRHAIERHQLLSALRSLSLIDDLTGLYNRRGFADLALQKTADILRATFRRSDIVARLGGDEFAVLALEASGESAEALIDRLRERFREFNETSREPFRLSVSIGMSRQDGDVLVRLDDLLADADRSMYDEKKGKQRVAMGG